MGLKLLGITEFMKNRAVPLGALAVATVLTFPVIAVGMNDYTITDGVMTETVTMYGGTPQAVLEQSSFDQTNYCISTVIKNEDGFEVTVKPNYYVNVVVDGKSQEVYTGDATVASIIRKAGIELHEEDITEPAQQAMISSPSMITVTRVVTKQATQTQTIPFETETRESSELEIGTSRVVQKGIAGLEEVTLEYTYHDGEQVACAQLETKRVKEPVAEIVENGTKQPTIMTSTSTRETYSRVLTMEATAYSGGGVTASGRPARYGNVAVDPRVIPLGTRLYIPDYGIAIAADTGGAIKGNRIDLYLNSNAECLRFGRRSVTVYVLN